MSFCLYRALLLGPDTPMLHNHGNYVCSLGQVVRWLGKEAEALGVDIFLRRQPRTCCIAAKLALQTPKRTSSVRPGVLPCSQPTRSAHALLLLLAAGIVTADAGIGKDGQPKDSFAPGMEIVGKQTLFAEGARGSCSEDVMARFQLQRPVRPADVAGSASRRCGAYPRPSASPASSSTRSAGRSRGTSTGAPSSITSPPDLRGGGGLGGAAPQHRACAHAPPAHPPLCAAGCSWASWWASTTRTPTLNPYQEFQRQACCGCCCCCGRATHAAARPTAPLLARARAPCGADSSTTRASARTWRAASASSPARA